MLGCFFQVEEHPAAEDTEECGVAECVEHRAWHGRQPVSIVYDVEDGAGYGP